MKRSTTVVLIIFVALAGLLGYLKQKDDGTETADVETTPTTPVEFLLTNTDGVPTTIDIQSNIGEQVTIARNESGLWVLKQPIETEANQGSAEAAATQLKSLRIVSRPEVNTNVVGLVPPSYTLTVELSSGSKKVVRIGDITPTGSGYYTNVEGSDEVLILSKDGLDSLFIMLESPPYESTPSP